MPKIIIAIGILCSGKNHYMDRFSDILFDKVDVGDIVREITKTEKRVHDVSLDTQIAEILINKIQSSILKRKGIIIVGLRQRSIFEIIEKSVGFWGISPVILDCSLTTSMRRFEKRAATKDAHIIWNAAYERDSKLGLTELITYFIQRNAQIISYDKDVIQESLQWQDPKVDH